MEEMLGVVETVADQVGSLSPSSSMLPLQVSHQLVRGPGNGLSWWGDGGRREVRLMSIENGG